jgi:hypothetical protein
MGEAVQVFDQWKIFTGKFGANFIKYFFFVTDVQLSVLQTHYDCK